MSSAEKLWIEYREFRKDMKSFPVGSPMFKRTKEKLGDFLKSVKERYGQEMVDKLTKGKNNGS